MATVKNKTPEIFLSPLRVFLPSFFTTTQLAAFSLRADVSYSLRAESSPFPPCRKERKTIKEKTTKKKLKNDVFRNADKHRVSWGSFF